MATSMRPGHRFLKGAEAWSRFYARVVEKVAGVRLDNEAARHLAWTFLATLWLAHRRLDRGELLAAQFTLHRVLAETNFRLMRELQLRRGDPVPSFGLARRAEALWPASELAWMRLSARLDREELSQALWLSFEAMKKLMAEIVPEWSVPASFVSLVARYRENGRA